jgi:stalled ribosome rescue protein Dom34
MMDRNVGLWIDHKQAFAIWSPDGTVQVIQSHIEPPSHFSGGTQLGGKLNQKGDVELHHNDRFRLQLNKYYQQVILALREADSILIMGPGQAKTELEKAIKKHKDMQNRILKVETVDKMTKNQMIAYVQKFYKNQAIT